jgi:hypothetical protein
MMMICTWSSSLEKHQSVELNGRPVALYGHSLAADIPWPIVNRQSVSLDLKQLTFLQQLELLPLAPFVNS